MVFPVVMCGCESWTIKKLSIQELMLLNCDIWRRLLKVPWTARRFNQSILKEISPKYSLEGLVLKLKLQYFGHLMWITDPLEKTLMLGKIEGRGEGDVRGWYGWMASSTRWTWVWASSGSWWWIGKPVCCHPWSCKELDMTEWLNWTEIDRVSGIRHLGLMYSQEGNRQRQSQGRRCEDGWRGGGVM